MRAFRRASTVALGIACLLLSCGYRASAVWSLWYVAPGGSNASNCLSVATACRTIQAAINKAAAGDTVRVEAGTYSAITNGESFPITLTKQLVIFGFSSATTIVDAADSTKTVFDAQGSNIDVYISSFRIQGGDRGIKYIGYYPGSITGEIKLNQITGNVVGIYTSASQTEIVSNDISFNTVHGVLNDASTPTIKRNTFAGNGSGGLGAAISNLKSSPWIINNLIGWNNGTGILNAQSSPVITNNTISFNFAGSGVANFNGSNSQITNNIITSNGVYGIHAQNASVPTNSYNDVWANAWADYYSSPAGVGSISADPRFVSWFDLHLQCSSPAINRGNNAAPYVPNIDFDGKPRPVGGIVDMGGFEKQTGLFCPIFLPLLRR